MNKDKTVFKCTECDKTHDAGNYPYKEGWFYLHKFEWKDNKTIKKSANDKHFCSKKCFVKFIEKA